MSKSAVPGLKFLIAEDHSLMRKMTRQLLGSFYTSPKCDEADSIAELTDLVKAEKYDVLILDFFLTDGNTATSLRAIRALQPDAAILFFTMCPEKLYGKRLIMNGANGFLNKTADEHELKIALDTLLDGDNYISRKLQQHLTQELLGKKSDNPFDSLSDREFEVMLLLLQGKSVSEVSNELSLHISTVATHKTRLFEKLSINSLIDLNKMASAYELTA